LGAFRDSEVTENHPLFGMFESMKDMSVEVIDIHLNPLDQESVERIIGDTLHRDPSSKRVREDPEMQTLIELVFAKTQGNPFFVAQLLKSLHRGGHIHFDFAAKGGGQWRFNLNSIEADDLPPTVVDLLVKQMLNLPEATRTIMMLASCFGSERISLEVLAIVSGKRIDGTASDLWGALDAGLILPSGGNYEIHLTLEGAELERARECPSPADGDRPRTARLSPGVPEGEEEATYRFLHDRVRQAAYSLIPVVEQAGVHRMIGMRLFEAATEEDLNGGMIYEVVNQLNHWLSPLSPDERKTLMELNLRAGKKALQATAFATALNYFSIAKKVLDDVEKEKRELSSSFKKQPLSGFNNGGSFIGGNTIYSPDDQALDELGTEINISLMESYFADVKYKESIDLVEEILPRCRQSKDKVRCLINKMNCLLIQGRLNEAIEAGLRGLSVLNWEVPLDDADAQRHAEMIRPRILLDVRQIKAIAKMHELKDENLLLLQEIISTLLLPVYMARPALLPAVCFTSVAITLEFGISMAGAYPILMTGVMLGAEASQEGMVRSYAYGRLALNLIEKENLRHPSAPAIYEVYAGHIGAFHDNMTEVLQCLHHAVTAGISFFNVDYTIFAMVELTSFGMMSGENLNSVNSKMMATKPNIRRFRQESGMWFLFLPLQFLLNLRGVGNTDPLCFEGAELGDSKDLARLASSENLSHIYIYHMYRLIMAALYGYWELTADLATHCCEPLSVAATGTFYFGLTAWYSSVAFLTLHNTLTATQRQLLDRNMTFIKEWSTRAKGTWLHKSVLLEAEALKTSGGQQLEILDRYDCAISLANKSGFIHDAAFISERCGLWLLNISKKRATPYIRDAYRSYNGWGAVHKAQELRKQFSEDIISLRGEWFLDQVCTVVHPNGEGRKPPADV
jgi:osomolarity two-component system sensor histidine kinase CHK1